MNVSCRILDGLEVGGKGLVIVGGPCVIENEGMVTEIATFLARLCESHRLEFIFKASYAKANRTSGASFRGPGLRDGLRMLSKVRERVGCPVLTDVHEPNEATEAAHVADVLQIPAFLCRQTTLLEAAGQTGKTVNIKKGQFMAPADMRFAAEKVKAVGGGCVMLTERGTFFGYNDLVVDMRSLVAMKSLGYPVLFDATHSTQKPGGLEGKSGGQRELAFPLARAATAVGVHGIYIEVHPKPERALSDAASQLGFEDAAKLVEQVSRIHNAWARDLP
jgi:2-dehydro-3-deoxyphosphooctonate aldolase (KDO 8-P synthase)